MRFPIDLIMFDLDGTLADTSHDLADAVNHTRAHFGLAPLPQTCIVASIGRGVEYLLRHSLPEQATAHFAEALKVFLDRYEAHLLDTTALYPGVRPALDHFRHKRRVVVSNKIERLASAILEGLGVGRCFDAIVGGDSVAEKKPHPAMLQRVLLTFGVAPEDAVIVGDGSTDIEAGKRARVRTCGVTYGFGSKASLLAAGPDLLIDDLNELREHFY